MDGETQVLMNIRTHKAGSADQYGLFLVAQGCSLLTVLTVDIERVCGIVWYTSRVEITTATPRTLRSRILPTEFSQKLKRRYMMQY